MSRHLLLARRFGFVVAIALGVLLAAETAVLAASLKRTGGPVNALYTATSADGASFSTFGIAPPVPGMTLTINVPEKTYALLLITFSAETRCESNFAEGDAGCEIRATVDGQTASPGFVEFASAPEPSEFHYQTHSMQFVAGPLGSGAHIVRIRWSVSEYNTSFSAGGRTLSVLVSKVGRVAISNV